MPARQDQLKSLFQAALELPRPARQPFLEARCDDPELRCEVAGLLASLDRAGDFLDYPGGLEAAVALAAQGSPMPGQRFGVYRMVRELGAGGMGMVYLGTRDDAEFCKDVAVKVIRRDATSDLNLRRFRQERQILADLDHPNIARLLDGGTTAEGIPYLVMELVDGVPVDSYAVRHDLCVESRLDLFEQVCEAVAHAHQRGIVHRDLKPSNILVTAAGSVKLLDFGIAKLLEADAALAGGRTATLSRMLTPEYASPEQVRGASVSAASDTYSLGVLLYRLLTGRSPYRVASDAPHDLARAICEEDPPKLTTAPTAAREPADGRARGRVGRDLDSIVCKAMRKRPGDRYPSVEALAEDIRRYRAGLPVSARRATLLYRSRRYVARHRAGSVVAALGIPLLVFLAGGPADTPPAGRNPLRPLTVALLPLHNASLDSSQDYFVDGVTEALIGQLGTIPDVRVISRNSAMRYRASSKPLTTIARELGADLVLEGEVLHAADRVRITLRMRDGETARMLWSESRARSAREIDGLHGELVAAIVSATDVSIRGHVLERLSTVRAVDPDVYEAYLKGRYHWNQRTEGSLQRALQYYQQALDLDPTYAPAHVGLADCYNQLGTLMVGTDSPSRFRPAAAAAAVTALQIDAQLAEAHATLGYVKHYDWDWAGAEQQLKRAIELNPSYALARIWYANLLMSRRRFDEAIREVLLARDLDPFSPVVNTNVGWVLTVAGRHEDAIQELQKTLRLDPDYAQARWRLAQAYTALRRFDDAIREGDTVVRLTRRAPSSVANLARIYAVAGQTHEARRLLDEVLAVAKDRYVSPGAIASVYMLLKEKEPGLRWLQKAYEERSNFIAYLAVEQYHVPDEVRGDRRFGAVLRGADLE